MKIKQSFDVSSQSKSRREAITMFASFSYSVGERNYGAIFKAQIMAEVKRPGRVRCVLTIFPPVKEGGSGPRTLKTTLWALSSQD